jgi:hypothetical protein
VTSCRNCGQPYNELANINARRWCMCCQGCERTGHPAWLIPERALQALPPHEVLEEGIAYALFIDEGEDRTPAGYPYVAVRYADGTEDVLGIDWDDWEWDGQD